MDREEALELLRRRTRGSEVVDLLARRHPDVAEPARLVPLALGLLAESDTRLEPIAERVPELSEICREVLRRRLQDKSFDEISEELDTDALGRYASCRKRLFPRSKALPEYAASTLNDEELEQLYVRALHDQATFDSLRDEYLLMDLLRSPSGRARLSQAVDDVRFTFTGTFQEWLERPKSKVLLGLTVVAGLAILWQECGRGFFR